MSPLLVFTSNNFNSKGLLSGQGTMQNSLASIYIFHTLFQKRNFLSIQRMDIDDGSGKISRL